jgi:hypothetical protein
MGCYMCVTSPNICYFTKPNVEKFLLILSVCINYIYIFYLTDQKLLMKQIIFNGLWVQILIGIKSATGDETSGENGVTNKF